jgi:hypothetical protein
MDSLRGKTYPPYKYEVTWPIDELSLNGTNIYLLFLSPKPSFPIPFASFFVSTTAI